MQKELVNHFTWLVNMLSEIFIYESWSDEFARKEMKDSFNKFYNSLKLDSNSNLIDWNNLTNEQASELRFNRWANDKDIDQDIWEIKNEKDTDVHVGSGTKEERIQRLENTRKLRLIPLYLYPLIPLEMELVSIFGAKVKNNGKLDSDTRGGCLAYGIIINESEEKSNENKVS